MKRHRPKPPPRSIPRLGSLLHRLQHAPDSEERPQTCLDQLMIFLDDPPPGTHDRWKAGAEMCTVWGIPSSGASVWRLYRSYVFEWRLRLARESDSAVHPAPQDFEKKADEFLALRTYEILTNPHSLPDHVVDLARIQVQRKSHELARETYSDQKQTALERGFHAIAGELANCPEAATQFHQMKAILDAKRAKAENALS